MKLGWSCSCFWFNLYHHHLERDNKRTCTVKILIQLMIWDIWLNVWSSLSPVAAPSCIIFKAFSTHSFLNGEVLFWVIFQIVENKINYYYTSHIHNSLQEIQFPPLVSFWILVEIFFLCYNAGAALILVRKR